MFFSMVSLFLFFPSEAFKWSIKSEDFELFFKEFYITLELKISLINCAI